MDERLQPGPHLTSSLTGTCNKTVLDPIPHTQHRPIVLKFRPVMMPPNEPFKRRFNCTKANGKKFAETLDEEIAYLLPTLANYENFISAIMRKARHSIPRGCRTFYTPGLSDESEAIYDEYLEQYSRDSFVEETTQLGDQLLESISKERRDAW